MAEKMHSSQEKALKAILKADQSRVTFQSIRQMLGKQNTPLTQVDIKEHADLSSDQIMTISNKSDVEHHILCRNRKHSLQVLQTPFLANHAFADAADPTSSSNLIDSILRGDYMSQHLDTSHLNPTECQWISSLSTIIKDQIPLNLSIDDIKKFFNAKQEKTSSSPSGRHMKHYIVALEFIRQNNLSLPNLILSIAHISLTTATPLTRWNKAS
jgi:hypothetical protein